jgi:hypothetical protein
MGQKIPAQSYTGAPFIPTSPRTGSEVRALFRGENMVLRGKADRIYAECYGGNYDLSETIDTGTLTGTLSFSPSSTTVTGTTTDFIAELHLGQLVLAGDELLAVDTITSTTVFNTTRLPTTTGAGLTGYRLPRLFAMDKQRGTLLSGNALTFDQGTILFIGSGTLLVNGAQLTANSGTWTASAQAKIAIYNTTSNWYDIFDLGMAPSGSWSATNVAGGTKNMAAGTYSLQIVPAKSQAGWNNPLEPYASVTVTAGQKVRVTFPAMDTANGQNAWRVYVTELDIATTQTLYKSGPWYYYQTVTATDLGGTGSGTTYDFEWLSAEVNRGEQLQFDNDVPLDAEFITAAPAGYPVYVSCQGKGTPTKSGGAAPGPSLLPTRPGNIEASPLTGIIPLSPPETIIGFAEAAGRLYLMTPNSLPIAVFTANPNFPITVRPFWKSGFKNPNSLAFVTDTLYGYTTRGMTRSIATGDEGSESNEFATDVKELTQSWNPGMVSVGYDQQNQSVCFFHAADELNDDGYWTTAVLSYSLQLECWHPLIRLTSSTGDMIVSGVATVDGNLQFLAGGRQGIGGVAVNTYTWDTTNPNDPPSIPWYLAWALSNGGDDSRDKVVRALTATGKFTAGQMDLYGYGADDDIDIAALEDNTDSVSGAVSLGTTTGTKITTRKQLCCPNLNMYTPRVSGTWAGTGTKDRVDEILVEAAIEGVRR